jgi:hypothetical protein
VGNQKGVGLSAILIRFDIAAVVCDDDDCGGNARQLTRGDDADLYDSEGINYIKAQLAWLPDGRYR